MVNIKRDDDKPAARVLIIDDCQQNLFLLSNILKKYGYEIQVAENGKDGIVSAENNMPHLILLDVTMAGLDGFEVCEELKKKKETSEIPVIFLTARRESDVVVRAFKSGAVDFVSKPFKTAELLARVSTHIELKQVKDEQRKLIDELEEALNQVKKLSGLLPICSNCKKVRDDHGFWDRVERYIENHSEVQFSHALCPDCLQELYPDLAPRVLRRMEELEGQEQKKEG